MEQTLVGWILMGTAKRCFPVAPIQSALFPVIGRLTAILRMAHIVCSAAGSSVIMPNLDYNYWSGCNSYSDPHGQTSTPAFVNATNGDFRLAAATSPGDNTLAAIYDTDSLGNTRGADGVWDRGA